MGGVGKKKSSAGLVSHRSAIRECARANDELSTGLKK